MKNPWKTIKFGVLLFALPLVATAAASAHQWVIASNPISLDIPAITGTDSEISMERAHTVALNRNGAVEGRIVTIEAGSKNTKGIAKLKIFFVQDGKVVKESYTKTDGTFVVEGVPEGAYSFVATGQDGFAAYGVRVVEDSTGKYEKFMEIAAVSKGLGSVKQIVNDGLSVVDNAVIDEKSITTKDEFPGANLVKLVDGSFHGRVLPIVGSPDLVAQTQIHILARNNKIAEVEADKTGAFEVPDLEPGVYDFVAIGPSGVAVLAFEAVESEKVLAVGLIDAEANPVSIEVESATEAGLLTAPSYAASFNVLLIEPQDVEPTPAQDDLIDTDGGGVADSIEVARGTDPNDARDDDAGALPIEFAGQDGAFGTASGGSAGTVGDFSNFAATPTTGAGAGGPGLAGGGRLVRWGLIGGIIAVAVTSGDPDDGSPNEPN